MFLGGAGRIVAQALHGEGGFGPDASQNRALLREENAAVLANCDFVAGRELAAGVNGIREAVVGETRAYFRGVGFADLHDRAQLFAEEWRQRIVAA